MCANRKKVGAAVGLLKVAKKSMMSDSTICRCRRAKDDVMRRKNAVTVNIWAWERRRYWLNGSIVDEEVWNAGRILPKPPRQLPSTTSEADYCQPHRTRIYPDLACQFCGERPVPRVTVASDDINTW